MAEFDTLKSQWEKQPQPNAPIDGAKQIVEKIERIASKQRITNFVLAATGIVLIFFFFYISAFKYQTVMFGLILMIAALAVRIVIEILSIRSLRHFDVAADATKFKKNLSKYYKNRKKVHVVLTPIIGLVYCLGFIMLLPSFKANLPIGMYHYILISAVILLLVLGWLIAVQTRNELRMLRTLNS